MAKPVIITCAATGQPPMECMNGILSCGESCPDAVKASRSRPRFSGSSASA